MKTVEKSKADKAPPRSSSSVLPTGWTGRLVHPLRGLSVQSRFLAIALPLMIALLLGAFAVLQMVFYHEARQDLRLDLAKESSSQALLLSAPLREGDLVTVRRLLTTIISDTSFISAAVFDGEAEPLAAVGDCLVVGDSDLVRAQEITFADKNGVRSLGTLFVRVTDTPIKEALASRAAEIAVLLAILAIGLGLAVNLAYRITIGRPLATITGMVESTAHPADQSTGGGKQADDLATLATALDRFRSREGQLQSELKTANLELEIRIAERTGELSSALAELTAKTVEIEQLALQDSLTGLPNRRAFLDSLKDAVANATENGTRFYVAMIDLDRFKNINDTLGHPVGDQLLVAVAGQLQQTLGNKVMIARLGGDEFAILAQSDTCRWSPRDMGRRLVRILNASIRLDDMKLYPGASIGICRFPQDAENADQILAYADIALFRAKDDGRGRYCLFDKHMKSGLQQSDRLEVDLRQALASGGLELHYQPQYRLATRDLVGFEALLRWRHPELGPISPAEFLPIAQERNLIHPIGRFVVDRVIEDMRRWSAQGIEFGSVSINIHPMELMNPEHMDSQIERLRRSGFEPDRFVFEITEDCIVGRGAEGAPNTLDKVRAAGFALSLDDFGTGYASLKHLRELPISEIKIDKEFVRQMTEKGDSNAIISAIAFVAKSLDLRMVAEGIETEDQLELLSVFDGVIGQGYHLGRPADWEAVTERLRTEGSPIRSLSA